MCTAEFNLFCSKLWKDMYSVHAVNACSMLSSVNVAELTHSSHTRVSVCQILELDHVCPLSPSVGPRCLCHTGPESTGATAVPTARQSFLPGCFDKGTMSGISARPVNTNSLIISLGDSLK